MKLKFYAIPALAPEAAETELNRFFDSHRVFHIERQFLADGAARLHRRPVRGPNSTSRWPVSLFAPRAVLLRRGGLFQLCKRCIALSLSPPRITGFGRRRVQVINLMTDALYPGCRLDIRFPVA